uniref:Uncharacterized protein n=1 Tax=Aegilops tauschii subsp. strangulata TaxID=200361 RepID=A0A453BD88_AEGTS
DTGAWRRRAICEAEISAMSATLERSSFPLLVALPSSLVWELVLGPRLVLPNTRRLGAAYAPRRIYSLVQRHLFRCSKGRWVWSSIPTFLSVLFGSRKHPQA